jgi:hypothetical protein
MFILAIILIIFVYHFQISHSTTNINPSLQFPGLTDESDVYYVNLSATFITAVASWSSSLAPLLVGFILALYSYPLSKSYLEQMRRGQNNDPNLFTPYQLAIALRFLGGGGVGAIWNWSKYAVGDRTTRQHQSSALLKLSVLTVIATILRLGFLSYVFSPMPLTRESILVFISDAWLHYTTTAVNFINVSPLVNSDGIDCSFVMNQNCSNNMNSSDNTQALKSCAVSIAATNAFLINGTQSLQVLSNVSNFMTASTYNNDKDGKFVYLGVPASSTLAPRDYKASTYGVQTQCQPYSTKCNLQAAYGASTPFYCPEAFQGDLTMVTQEGEDPNWSLAFFPNSSLSSNETILTGVQNPFWYGLGALVDAQELWTYQFENGPNDPNLVVPVHGGVAFILLCNSTIYDMNYTSINGSLNTLEYTLSNASVTNIFQGTISITNFGTAYLQEAATLAGLSTSSEDISNQMALSFSKAILSAGAQALQASPAIAAQERSSLIVARVPKAPLFTVIILDLLFVVIGIAFSVLALASSSGGANADVREVQARLSVVGLVADRFEGRSARGGIRDLKEGFEEFGAAGGGGGRVVLDQTAAGGWEFVRR